MKEMFKNLKITLTDEQINAFKTYYDFLISENKKYNLTGITEYEEVLIKHFYDSLTLLKVNDFKDVVTVADIGSGAGFPGIPLKIINPGIKLTLVESQTKKANFLKELITLLKLNNVDVVNKRAEEFAQHNKEKFDIVTARAVAPLNILNELTLPLVKVGGLFLAMKGDNYEEELKNAKNGIMVLGGSIKNVVNFDLPLQFGKRTIIIIKKTRSVNKYPRQYRRIKNNPL